MPPTQGQNRPYDVYINGTGYILLPQPNQPAWAREKPDKAEYVTAYQDLRNGKLDGEFIVSFDNNPALGWGESRRVVPGRYAYGVNVNASIRGQVTLGPLISYASISPAATDDPRQICELPGLNYYWLAWGRYLIQITPGTITTVTQADCGAGNAFGMVVPYDSQIYAPWYTVSSGNGGGFYFGSGASFTASTARYPDAIVPLGDSQGAELYAIERPNGTGLSRMIKYLSGKAGPAGANTASNWSGQINFGDAGETYRWMVGYGVQAFGGCARGLFTFDENRNPVNILEDLGSNRSANNCRGARVWKGAIYVPYITGLLRYDGNVGDVSPTNRANIRLDENSRRFGYPVACVGDGRNLYVSMWNGTDTYVLAGRLGGWGEPDLIWNTLLYIAGYGPYTCMHITAITDPPRLFLVSKGATNTLAYCDLSRTENPLQDPQAYNATGTWYSAWHNFGIAGLTSTLEEVIVESESPTTGETLTVYYRNTDTPGASWTSLGTITPTAGQVNAPLVSTLRPSSTATGVGFQFRVDFARGTTTTNTPILRSLKARVLKRFNLARVWTATLLLEDQHEDRFGNRRTEDGNTLLANLTGLESGTAPFNVTPEEQDIDATPVSCLLAGTVQEIRVAKQRDEMPLRAAKITVREFGA